MQFQFNSDNKVNGSQNLAARIEQDVRTSLAHFEARLTRIEVHISDVDGRKRGPADKRCMLEARPHGLGPVAVSHEADSVDQAVLGAASKLTGALERVLGRLTDRKGH
ncbi:MAG TPA: HPF/RaiA family ribosome-associated protein [Sphingomonadaceae bacterium]|nr:HPF/RaiA family ribosome-associated protein [Sphingomonadaceae bacterium]